MKSLWDDTEAAKCENDPLRLRVYTSRLLGADEDLVLQGGGNTSVKANAKNLFGESEELLYVKGSGWDLATIEEAGFPGVRIDRLKKLVKLNNLSDTEMVREQRLAMVNPNVRAVAAICRA